MSFHSIWYYIIVKAQKFKLIFWVRIIAENILMARKNIIDSTVIVYTTERAEPPPKIPK